LLKLIIIILALSYQPKAEIKMTLLAITSGEPITPELSIKRQGCKYFALIIRMFVALLSTCWGTSC
jgi:hypothetical protein